MYTHHQKTVICDAPLEEDEGGLRRIIAFIGERQSNFQYHLVC